MVCASKKNFNIIVVIILLHTIKPDTVPYNDPNKIESLDLEYYNEIRSEEI